jgi:Glycosyl hydrolases family 2, sugar binding domain
VFVVFRTPQSSAPHAVAVSPEASLRTDAQNQTVLSTAQNGDYAITWSDGSTKTVSVKGLPAPLTLDGSWNVEFPPFAAGKGEPVKTTFDKLTSWSDSSNDTIKYFSGTATYTKTFTLPAGYSANQRPLLLDLGSVKNIAEVTLNGKPLGILWKEPFQADVTASVRAGENTLTIQITNLWPNRLIGDQKLDLKDRLTWASVSSYKATDPLLPSGLLGPVTLRAKSAVTIQSQ